MVNASHIFPAKAQHEWTLREPRILRALQLKPRAMERTEQKVQESGSSTQAVDLVVMTVVVETDSTVQIQ